MMMITIMVMMVDDVDDDDDDDHHLKQNMAVSQRRWCRLCGEERKQASKSRARHNI